MPHQYIGRRGKPVNQQAHFIIHVQIERTAHLSHTFAAQPVLCGAKQGRNDSWVFVRLQHTEIACGVIVLLQMQLVNLGANATHRLTFAIGNPGAPTGVFKKMIFGRDLLALHQTQRSNPGRIRRIDAMGQLEKLAHLPGLGDHLNGQWCIINIAHGRLVLALSLCGCPAVYRRIGTVAPKGGQTNSASGAAFHLYCCLLHRTHDAITAQARNFHSSARAHLITSLIDLLRHVKANIPIPVARRIRAVHVWLFLSR